VAAGACTLTADPSKPDTKKQLVSMLGACCASKAAVAGRGAALGCDSTSGFSVLVGFSAFSDFSDFPDVFAFVAAGASPLPAVAGRFALVPTGAETFALLGALTEVRAGPLPVAGAFANMALSLPLLLVLVATAPVGCAGGASEATGQLGGADEGFASCAVAALNVGLAGDATAFSTTMLHGRTALAVLLM
jgi:hypothetical protein